MKLNQCTEFTNDEKLEMIKEHLGWYFGGVAPMAWNPYEYPGHVGFMLDTMAKEGLGMFDSLSKQLFGQMSPYNIMMMPSKAPEKIIDICGCVWGLWSLKRPNAEGMATA